MTAFFNPGYTFLGDPSVALSAAVSTRYTSNSLKGILTDIYLLSKSDYLVCTFSSQVSAVFLDFMSYDPFVISNSFRIAHATSSILHCFKPLPFRLQSF